MSTELSAAIGAVNSSAPSAKPAVRRCTCGLVGVVPSGAVIGSRRSRNDDSRFGTAASRWANAVSGEPPSVLMRVCCTSGRSLEASGTRGFCCTAKRFRAALVSSVSVFRNRDGHRCRGVRTPGPAAAAAALESAAHLHYVDCLQSSLVSIPVFPVLYCRFSFLLLFRCSFRNVTRYSAHMKIARTHCTSAFERFFRRNQPYQYVLSDSRNMRWQSQYRYRIRIDIA